MKCKLQRPRATDPGLRAISAVRLECGVRAERSASVETGIWKLSRIQEALNISLIWLTALAATLRGGCSRTDVIVDVLSRRAAPFALKVSMDDRKEKTTPVLRSCMTSVSISIPIAFEISSLPFRNSNAF